MYLTVELDSLLKKEKILVLSLIALDSSGNEIKTNLGNRPNVVVVLTNKTKKPLKNYKYLSYIGTNFDLVEGIKADNLFFATNVFWEPTKNTKDFGIYLSLYGNRTTSLTEESEQDITTEIVPVTPDSSYRLKKTVKVIKTTTSDNLGAHFSTLHPILNSRTKKQGVLKTYFTVSTDFIWKRTHILTEYGEVTKVDTSRTVSTGRGIILNPLRDDKISINQFNFNIGPGLFFVLENNDISARIHASAGYTRIFVLDGQTILKEQNPKDIYFAGRAWITEPKTGITLQAEVTNRHKYPAPAYVVTLSKAFNLDKLAGIFSPITAR